MDFVRLGRVLDAVDGGGSGGEAELSRPVLSTDPLRLPGLGLTVRLVFAFSSFVLGL